MTSRRAQSSSSSASLRSSSADPQPSWEGFRKLFASVGDPQTLENHARHLALTKNVLYENEHGWKVAELPLVSDLLALLRDKVLDGAPQFVEQLLAAITLCGKPFIRQKSNEEISNPTLLHGLLPTLGELLSFGDVDVQVAAAEALRQFATGACLVRDSSKVRSNNVEGNPNDLRLTPRVFSQNLLEETGTVDMIVAVMHDLFPDNEPEEIQDQRGNEPSTNEELMQPENNQTSRSELEPETVSIVSDQPFTAPADLAQEGGSSNHLSTVSVHAIKPSSAPQSINRGTENPQGNVTIQASIEEAGSLAEVIGGSENGSARVNLRPKHPFSAPSAVHRGDTNGAHTTGVEPESRKPSTAPKAGDTNLIATFEESEKKPEVPKTSASTPNSEERNSEQLNPSGSARDEVVVEEHDAISMQVRLSAVLFPLVDLLYELSNHQRCAEVLVVTGALHYVVFILENIVDPQDELLPLCLVILWNVLELCQEKMAGITHCVSRRELLEHFRLRNATYFLGNEFTFHALLHVLELLLAQGYRQQDKELRNECLMILQLLAKRRRSLDFFYSTGLTGCLFSYATAAEFSLPKAKASMTKGTSQQDSTSGTPAAITANTQYYATNSDEDFEFKQMLWFLLADITCDHDANLSELVQFRFLEIWLSYATNTANVQDQGLGVSPPTSGAHKYSPPQLQLLQTTALSVLNHVTPFVLDHLYELGGHVTLLKFLQLNMGSEDVLAAAWLLMVQISPPIPFFQTELGALGAIETAVDIFHSPPSRHTFAIRRNAILACANMCRDDDGSNRQRFLHANGVHELVEHLEFDPSHSILEGNILIGIVDAVRSCVVGDLQSETAFINAGGVPKLLGILGPAPKAMKHQILAALAEICVNPAAIPSYQSWRSDQPGVNNNANASQVLLRIYADEEAAERLASTTESSTSTMVAHGKSDLVASTNVRHSAFQSITNCRSPFIITPETGARADESQALADRPESPAFARLKEALKAAQGMALEKNPRRSILQLEDNQVHPEVNLKAKIYSVLANVSFACDTDSLTPHDQVMLEIAKEYPTFQIGEMWQNVQRALHAEGVRPIYADALYISKHIERAYNISVCTKLAQQEVFARTKQQTAQREDAFFEQILRQKHQEAQAEEFLRANRRQNSTMKLHFDAKKTRLEFMRRQDPAAFAAYESEERCRINDPPPEYVDEDEAWQTLQQNEAELRGRICTITRPRKHTV